MLRKRALHRLFVGRQRRRPFRQAWQFQRGTDPRHSLGGVVCAHGHDTIDAFSLGEAARNLLGNAIRHGLPPVSIGTERRGDRAILWVQDAGPGPDPAVTARLGERFNRNAGSRESSAGLGLSIVRSVAAAFDGAVEMTPLEDGFRAALVLPLAAEGK